METWFRDALQSRLRDDLERLRRSLDDLERLRARVAQRAIAVLSSESMTAACAVGTAGAGSVLGKEVNALRQMLLGGRDKMKRRYRLLCPSDAQAALCVDDLRRLRFELSERHDRIVGSEIDQCLKVLDRAASRCGG